MDKEVSRGNSIKDGSLSCQNEVQYPEYSELRLILDEFSVEVPICPSVTELLYDKCFRS